MTNDVARPLLKWWDPAGKGAWLCCGGALLLYCGLMTWISQYFVYGSPMLGRPIVPMVLLMMGAALVYFVAVYGAFRTTPTRRLAYGVFAVGAGMRLLMAPSLPVLEDDYYRYLWDGASVAHGLNPYAHRPLEIQERDEGLSEACLELGNEAGVVLHRINHPQLGTVYPAVAQGAFALAHEISPWRLSGLRVLYCLLDGAVFALLILLLRALDRSPLLVLIYWWNPLAIKEIYNSIHMDIVLIPLVLLALLWALHGHTRRAMVPLALAIATKIWPVLLALPLIVAVKRSPRAYVGALVLLAVLGGALLAPVLTAVALGRDSGFVAYGTRWEMNDALFMVFPWVINGIADLVGGNVDADTAHRGGKIIVMAIVGAVVLRATRRSYLRAEASAQTGGDIETRRQLCQDLLWIVAALFLLSPTQFPWYFLWMLPFLSLVPQRALLAYTFFLPLYYLRFYFDAHGNVDFFHNGVVWLEHGPIVLFLAVGVWKGHVSKTPLPETIE